MTKAVTMDFSRLYDGHLWKHFQDELDGLDIGVLGAFKACLSIPSMSHCFLFYELPSRPSQQCGQVSSCPGVLHRGCRRRNRGYLDHQRQCDRQGHKNDPAWHGQQVRPAIVS